MKTGENELHEAIIDVFKSTSGAIALKRIAMFAVVCCMIQVGVNMSQKKCLQGVQKG